MRCCKPLEATEVDVLNKIAALTPHRLYYPLHRRATQTITWHHSLGPLVQHGAFESLARQIIGLGEQFRMFYQDLPTVQPLDTRGDEALLHRARIRSSTYLNVEYGGSECTTDHDVEYVARDSQTPSNRSVRVHTVSSLVMQWRGDMSVRSQLVSTWTSWGRVGGFNLDFDLSRPISELLTLDLASTWGSLYGFCRSATREASGFRLLFLFAQIAYGSGVSTLDDLMILLAFATKPSLHGLKPFPDYQAFGLSNGSAPHHDKLESTIEQYVKPYTALRSNMSATERSQDYAEYQRLSAANTRTAVAFFMDQWPCPRPHPIARKSVKWLKTKGLEEPIRNLFAEWYKNRQCESHLALIQSTIQATMITTVDYTYQQSTWHQVQMIPRLPVNRLFPTLQSLMASRSPSALTHQISAFHCTLDGKAPMKNPSLRAVVTNIRVKTDKKISTQRMQYRDDLLASLDAFQGHGETFMPDKISHLHEIRLSCSLEKCTSEHARELMSLESCLEPQTPIHELLKIAGLWPRLCLHSILGLTASTSGRRIPQAWKESILTLGSNTATLQQQRRLVLAAEKGDVMAFYPRDREPRPTRMACQGTTGLAIDGNRE